MFFFNNNRDSFGVTAARKLRQALSFNQGLSFSVSGTRTLSCSVVPVQQAPSSTIWSSFIQSKAQPVLGKVFNVGNDQPLPVTKSHVDFSKIRYQPLNSYTFTLGPPAFPSSLLFREDVGTSFKFGQSNLKANPHAVSRDYGLSTKRKDFNFLGSFIGLSTSLCPSSSGYVAAATCQPAPEIADEFVADAEMEVSGWDTAELFDGLEGSELISIKVEDEVLEPASPVLALTGKEVEYVEETPNLWNISAEEELSADDTTPSFVDEEHSVAELAARLECSTPAPKDVDNTIQHAELLEQIDDMQVEKRRGSKRQKSATRSEESLQEITQRNLTSASAAGFQCPECGLIIGTQSNLTRHKREVHVDHEKKYRCEHLTKAGIPCEYATHRKSDFTDHEKTHTGVKTNVCTVCDRAFRRKGELTTHMDTVKHRKRAAAARMGISLLAGSKKRRATSIA